MNNSVVLKAQKCLFTCHGQGLLISFFKIMSVDSCANIKRVCLTTHTG